MTIVTDLGAILVYTGNAVGTPGILAKKMDGTVDAIIGQFLADGTFARRKDNPDALKALGFQVDTDGGIKSA